MKVFRSDYIDRNGFFVVRYFTIKRFFIRFGFSELNE